MFACVITAPTGDPGEVPANVGYHPIASRSGSDCCADAELSSWPFSVTPPEGVDPPPLQAAVTRQTQAATITLDTIRNPPSVSVRSLRQRSRSAPTLNGLAQPLFGRSRRP